MKYAALLFLLACSTSPTEGDRRIHGDEVPVFLRSYRGKGYDDLEFFEKIQAGVKVYEVKYEIEVDDEDQEISVKYSDKGEFLEKEEDIDFEDIPHAIKEKIRTSIMDNYEDAKIHETERRTDKDQNEFIDVEIRHKSSPSGYWELTYDKDGNYVSRKLEHYENIETLN